MRKQSNNTRTQRITSVRLTIADNPEKPEEGTRLVFLNPAYEGDFMGALPSTSTVLGRATTVRESTARFFEGY